jgi:uncharacterized membrane protein
VVAAYQDADAPNYRFVIRPNRSLSWKGTQLFFAGMCAVSFGIATGFALIGAWLVLPFAGLEMGVLGVCLYLGARRSAACEVVSIRDDVVEIQKGRRAPLQVCHFQRTWARVNMRRPVNGWLPSRLTIRSHGREVEIGADLNEDERESLATELRRVIRWSGSAPFAVRLRVKGLA